VSYKGIEKHLREHHIIVSDPQRAERLRIRHYGSLTRAHEHEHNMLGWAHVRWAHVHGAGDLE
jgi:hypothetical protein